MKTVINGKIYDTETASVVCGKSTENLYVTPVEGEFFFACRVMKTIKPMSREAAMEYYGKCVDQQMDYETAFGEKPVEV